MQAPQHRWLRPNPQAQRILVTGGAGYIGSALLPKLIQKGYKVRLLDLFLYGAKPILDYVGHPNVEIIQADFRDRAIVEAAMRGIDSVIHLGAIVGDPACTLDQELTATVNYEATQMLAQIAKGKGIRRFLFASTCSVYGASDELLDETSSLNPLSAYARTKIEAEETLWKLAGDDFAPTFMRFGTIYGFSKRIRFDLVVNVLTAKAVTEKQIPIFGGAQWRPFIHVDDVALAILTILEAPLWQVGHEIFNIGSNEQNYQIQQVGELIHRIIPSAQVVEHASATDLRNYRVAFDKLQETLGFKPHWSMEAGVQQIVKAFVDQLISDHQAIEYDNFRFLREYGFPSFIDFAVNRPRHSAPHEHSANHDQREKVEKPMKLQQVDMVESAPVTA